MASVERPEGSPSGLGKAPADSVEAWGDLTVHARCDLSDQETQSAAVVVSHILSGTRPLSARRP